MRSIASSGFFRLVAAFLLLAGGTALTDGCRRHSTGTANARVDLHFEHGQPVIGSNSFTLRLTDEAGNPLRLQNVQAEGDMNHAGMKPAFATLDPVAPGAYSGTIEFTMGGDWFLLVSGKTPDGGRFETKVDVPGVRAK